MIRPPHVAPPAGRHVETAAVAVACLLTWIVGARLATSVDLAVAVALLAAPVVVVLVVLRPLAGVLLALLLLGLVPRATLEAAAVPVGPFDMLATDLLLGLVLAVWAGERLRGGRGLPTPRWVLVLLAALLTVGLVAVLTARSAGTPLGSSLIELRGLAVYLLIVPVVAFARVHDATRATDVLLAAAAIAAVQALLRYASGEGRPTLSGEISGRVLNDAFLLPMLGILVLAARWATGSLRTSPFPALAAVLLAALYTAALLVTFQRGAWLALAVGLLTIAVAGGGGGRRRLAAVALAATVAFGSLSGLLGVGLSTTTFGERVSERIASIRDNRYDASVQHRRAEWREAEEQIRSSPLTGIGLGTTISFYSPLYDERLERPGALFETLYIHNSFYWSALKTGLPGLAALLALLALCVARGVRLLRTAEPGQRPLRVMALGAVAAAVTLGLTGQHLTQTRTAAFVAVALGVLAARLPVAAEQEPVT